MHTREREFKVGARPCRLTFVDDPEKEVRVEWYAGAWSSAFIPGDVLLHAAHLLSARDAWEYTACLDGGLDDMGADGWEAYAAVVIPDGRGGQDVRHYLKRRVGR